MKKIFLTFTCLSALSLAANAQTWLVTGNTGITSSQFIGTKDSRTLDLRTNNISRMSINPSGYIGMGVSPVSSARLYNSFVVPNTIAFNSPYAGTRSRISGTSGTANGYLGTYYVATLGLTALPIGMNYMGVLGVMEISDSFGAGVVGWNKNNKAGGNHYGVYGTANGIPSGISNINDKNIGLYGTASNNMINIGVMGSAPGNDNWAGYFLGRVHTTDKVGIGTEQTSSMLNVDAPSGTDPVSISTSGTTRFHINDDGEVGIGTTNPTAKLHVRTTSDNRAVNISNFAATTNAIYGLDLTASNLSSGMSVGAYSAANGTGVNRAFEASATNGTTNYGVYSVASAGSGNAFGVYGRAEGGSSTNTVYGVYGTSSGSSNHWAGYFNGTTYSSTLRVGTTESASGYILSVGGKMICEEVKVALEVNWPDYVFTENYRLMPLEDLKLHIDENNHLPGIPSAKEVNEEGGYNLGEMQVKLLEKVEELTLYIIQLSEENKVLRDEINKLKK